MPLLTIAIAAIAAITVIVYAARTPRVHSADGTVLTHEARVRRGLYAAAVVLPLTTLVVLQAFLIRF